MRLHPLHLALALACAGNSTLHAEQPPLPDADSTRSLATITVTATLTERALDEVPNTVSVIDREQIEHELMSDIRDLVRYEPGVSARASLGRFGLSDFRIRGLDGNRVLIETDGVSVSDAFSIGSFSASNRNFVDLETLKAVEILRGPGSSLYGSDALGGVVSFITRDPVDYLGGDGRGSHFGLRTGFDGADDGVFGSVTAAVGNGRWSGLLIATRREGKEPDNHGDIGGEGSARTRPNPQDSADNSVLAKLLFEPNADQRFRLTLEGSEAETDTEVLGSLGGSAGFGNPVLIQSMLGTDLQTRARIALALYVRRIVREIGAMAAVLGGLDMLAFTAGVGEHNAFVRERVCRDLAFLGVELDEAANQAHAATISSPASRVLVAVEPTNEEWIAARMALERLRDTASDGALRDGR